jgi:hypothetical protein
LLREPLLHFLVAGVALFGGWRWLHPAGDASDTPERIELGADDVRQIQRSWLAQGRAALAPEQLRGLVEDRVREEILVREGRALGLDEDDTIVRRRLAQKMEFLFEDVAALRDPAPGELQDWYEQHAERFTLPARASFRHLYFSPDRRGAAARDDAARALGKLAAAPAAADAPALGDPFMFQSYYGDRSSEQIARELGPAFAQALLATAPGAWAGPIQSGYGWHLVWIDEVTPARVPAFEDVEADVRRAWTEEQRAAIRERAFAAMRSRYEVVLPAELDAPDVASLGAAAERTDEPR